MVFLFVNKHEFVRQWLRKWWTWWSQNVHCRTTAFLDGSGDDNDDVEERDEIDDDKKNFSGWGSWAVKESESEQDQDDKMFKLKRSRKF